VDDALKAKQGIVKMLESRVRSALFIDYDNVSSFFKQNRLSGRIGNILSWLEDGGFDPAGKKRRFDVKRVYWHRRYEDEAPAFEHHDFITQTCNYTAGNKQGQSAVDLFLAMDAIDATYKNPRLREVVILASDSDYLPLIQRLKERKFATCIVFSKRDASAVYQGEADFIIDDATLQQASTYVRKRGFLGAPANPPLAPRPAPRAPAPAEPPDLKRIAAEFADFVAANRGPNVGYGNAIKHLRKVRGFTTSGPKAWFGFPSYEALLEEFGRLCPRLKIDRYGNGGFAVRSAKPDAAQQNEAGPDRAAEGPSL